MIRRLLPLALLLGLGGCVVYPAPGYYGPPAYYAGSVYVGPRPFYRPWHHHHHHHYRHYGWHRW